MSTDPATLNALASEVEAGNGPDREIDARIEDAIGPSSEYPGSHLLSGFTGGRANWLRQTAPAYTASVDAALALAKSLLQGCAIDILYAIEPHDSDISHDCVVTVSGLSGPWVGLHVEVKHDNVPRAIVAATLRAVVGRG